MKIEHVTSDVLGEGAWLTIEEGQAYYMPGTMILIDDGGSTMKITWDEDIDDETMAEHMEKVMGEVAKNFIQDCFNKARD